tara:strand:+ start:865 stop:2166 length:1302 start_codon:yes stop_codon:yes gene_type:complete
MAQIEIKISVAGADYFVSDTEYMASNGIYYHGFVDSAPNLTVGSNEGGFLSVKSGMIVLTSEPDNAEHPFGLSRFTALLSQTAYAIEINFDTIYAMFAGSIILDQISNDQLRFVFYATTYSAQAISTVSDVDSNTQYNPFSHGTVTNRQPLVQTGANAFRNPSLATSGITVHEEGTDRFSSATSTTITTSGYSGKNVCVSGTGLSGTTLETFFDYVADTLSLDVTTADTTKTTSASSRVIHLYLTQPQLLVDLASSVAEATNHEFYIAPNPANGNTTLYLIDRANNPTATVIEDIDVLSTNYTLPFPIASVVGNFAVTERKGTQLFTQNVAVPASNVPVGSTINKTVLADTNAHVSEVATIITAIKNIEIKPTASITVADIQTSWTPGDRFTLNRKLDLISIDMIVRSINFNFETQLTTISGDATLTEFLTNR